MIILAAEGNQLLEHRKGALVLLLWSPSTNQCRLLAVAKMMDCVHHRHANRSRRIETASSHLFL